MSFCDNLKAGVLDKWNEAINHRFYTSLWSGTLPTSVLSTYLSQDALFVDDLISLLGGAVSNCDQPQPRIALAKQLGFIASDECDYFTRALTSLNAPRFPEILPVTQKFRDLINEARVAGYAETISLLLAAEWVYLDWATRGDGRDGGEKEPADWSCREWIELHRGEGFESWVELLKDETERVAGMSDEETRRRMREVFERCVELEIEFLEQAYAGK